ncbi:MAG: hypothetical protein FWF69_01010 [Firmicutes bacterium]|nr:hypothetical protein [Bacillota bacterium]
MKEKKETCQAHTPGAHGTKKAAASPSRNGPVCFIKPETRIPRASFHMASSLVHRAACRRASFSGFIFLISQRSFMPRTNGTWSDCSSMLRITTISKRLYQ